MFTRLARRLSKVSAQMRRSYVKRRHIPPELDNVSYNAVILEVGGGFNPRYVKAKYPNVYHLDHANTDHLRIKYSKDPSVAHLVHRIQPIDFVFEGRAIETLVPPDLRFELIYGSHVLEHQVDLIGHLRSLEVLLGPGGCVIEIIPDLRTCFDALRFPSVTSDVLLAHHGGAPTHRGKQVFDSVSREISANQGHSMCDADFDGVTFQHSLPQALQAMRDAEYPGRAYVDTHAWAFTPESFRLLMVELRLLGLIQLAPRSVSPTYGNQFCAVLERIAPEPAGPSAETVAALECERLALSLKLRLRS